MSKYEMTDKKNKNLRLNNKRRGKKTSINLPSTIENQYKCSDMSRKKRMKNQGNVRPM